MSTGIEAAIDTGVSRTGQPEPGPDGQPVGGFVLRLLPGAQLRRFREAAGITPEQAGYEIRASPSKTRHRSTQSALSSGFIEQAAKET